MLPLKDDNPTEITPFVTVVLIALNVGAWALLQAMGVGEVFEASVFRYGTLPCEITGECQPQELVWSTLVTAMFMHGSWSHLLGNMLYLWVFGNNIEDSMGHLRFVLFYLLCGVAASFAHILLDPASPIPAVGASGAISGIMGAYIVLYPRARVVTWIPPFWVLPLNAFIVLALWFGTQLLTGVAELAVESMEQGGVAVWAHVGGFVAGLLLIKVFDRPQLVDAKRRKVQLSREEVAKYEW